MSGGAIRCFTHAGFDEASPEFENEKDDEGENLPAIKSQT
jgi:hypothetical protein